jgi:hypothetical protein
VRRLQPQRPQIRKGVATRSAFNDEEQRKIDSMIGAGLENGRPERYGSAIYDIQRERGRYQGAVANDFSTASFRLQWPWLKDWDVLKLARTGTNLLQVRVDESMKN